MHAINRNRLINAIIYFAKNTDACGKIKLFKLLYLMDFETFRRTGKSVTGADYQAWKFGPVPIQLMEEWEQLGEDLARVVYIEEERVIDYVRQTVKVKHGVEFDPDEFTPRELRIMQKLVEQFHGTRAPAMIDVTHAQNGAWDKIWHDGQGRFKEIPYALSIPDDAENRADILAIAQQEEMYQVALQETRKQNAVQ
ncbi:Panacea domain-containing protein [Paraburkholderia sp. MPAMCS5]|uniref:Panacea domain-containing protein n=1 Tax=Paraburkholderia sp. MPAMCS5 TaxID=3112563 RepID=UPI002E16FCAC|nr:Panacea domain-containing protein [Paraburkholderia sp. MPAMCS5]